MNNLVTTYLEYQSTQGLSKTEAIEHACFSTGRAYNNSYMAWDKAGRPLPSDVYQFMLDDCFRYIVDKICPSMTIAMSEQLIESISVPSK